MEYTQALSMAYSITDIEEYAIQIATVICSCGEMNIDQARSYYKLINPDAWDAADEHRFKMFASLMQYEGFNPRQMIAVLLRKHKDMAQNIEASPDALTSVSGKVMDRDQGRSILVYTSNEAFHRDMRFVCWMFIIRTASFGKIKNMNKKLMVKIIDMLKHKYDINTTKRKPGVSLNSKIITVPRIAACFPTVTVKIFLEEHGRPIFEPSIIFGDVQMPRAMLAPMVASCIPYNLKIFQSILLAVSVAKDCTLHSEGQRIQLKRLADILEASFSSNAVPEEEKTKVCIDWGLLLKENEPAPFVEAARLKAVEYVRRVRVGDLDLEQVLASM
ncbi:uncharacterized protein LOC143306159 [Osmia lignaria lignaria]|uniref:uncharacterized protein LOC143306159 n=1 Tax=Osmia lignaria lignaria TaxID=1437193 RepID=UPI00402B806D